VKVAAGNVIDRPWGQTLGTVGTRKLTAQVNLHADDGKTYSVAFADGMVIAAASPLANDSVTRVALTSHLVSPSQVGEITRRLAAEKSRDEVEVLAEASKLAPDHVATLRRRLTIQRAARTFAIDRGTFEIEGAVTLIVQHDFTVPLGAVIFQGVRMNLSEQRLGEDLRELGSAYRMRSTTTDDEVAALELDFDAGGAIERLRAGTTLAELEARHRDIEPRTLHALIYALVCTGLCDATGGQRVDRTAPPPPRTSTGLVNQRVSTIRTEQPLVTRTRTPNNLNVPRTGTPNTVAMPRTGTPNTVAQPRTGTASNVATPRTGTSSTVNVPRTVSRPVGQAPVGTPVPARSPTRPGVATSRATTSSAIPTRNVTRPASTDEFRREPTTGDFRRELATGTPTDFRTETGTGDFRREAPSTRGQTVDEFSRDTLTAVPRTITTPRTITERERVSRDIEALIATRLAKLEQGADYFAILGVPFESPMDAVRAAYVETTRKLNPESLTKIGILEETPTRAAQRVLAQVNAAYQVLSDPAKRRDYVNAVRRGDPTPVAPRARTDALDKTELAAEAFAKGESALRRDDVTAAVEELGRAHTLAPTNLDYMAMFAWAQFCAASDKLQVYAETRKTLAHVINRSENPVSARFYLGRVERMLGHDREAMNHFDLVLMEEPGHKEAQSEVRVLQSRMAKGSKPKR
jgi:hypothetical protein